MDRLLEYFKNDDLAANVWKSKYAYGDEETPDDMHRRLSKEFARVEERYQRNQDYFNPNAGLSEYGKNREELTEESIYQLFKDFRYIIPQGSIMATLGTNMIASLSNCWVNESPYDSYAGIMKSDSELAFYYKRRGGVGQDISNLRPKGTDTSNAAKTSTGAVSFVHRFSNTTREVAMNGRRGALMLSISINHPDSMDFIKVKRDGVSVTGANISVRLTNEFMESIQNDEDYFLRWPCNTHIDESADFTICRYDVLIPMNFGYIKRIKARQYWGEIIKSARNHAEPGLMYWDNALSYDPAAVYEEYKPVCTNPCGEQYLNANDSCRLMALNLFNFVKNPFTEKAEIDYDLLYKISYEHCRLGDDLVDLELEYINRIISKIELDPEPIEVKKPELDLWKKSYEKTKSGRRVGLGLTSLGDMLAAIGLPYDSDKSVEVIEKVMKTKMKGELDCTIDLAILRGTFEGWNKDLEFPNEGGSWEDKGGNDFYTFLISEFFPQFLRLYKYGRRNVSWSTIAPTGTVSLMTQTTSGCEPLFQPFYKRRKKINPSEEGVRVDFVDEIGDSWQEFHVLHPKFKEWCKIWINTDYGDEQVFTGMPIDTWTKDELQIAFEDSPWYGSTANEIDWEKRVKIQGILQKYTTNAISSTINLPSTVTEEEVSKIYMHGWKLGLKGQTIYVDGSRSGVLVSDKKKDELVRFHENHAPKRPKSLPAKVVRFNNNYEKWVAFVGLMDDKPYEIFTGKLENVKLPASVDTGEVVKVNDNGSKRYDFVHDNGKIEDISRVFSPDFWNYGKLISGILRHGMPLNFVVDTIQELNLGHEHINTWKNGVSRTLKKFIKDGEVNGAKCKDCGSSNVRFEEGCMACKDCGSSKCG